MFPKGMIFLVKNNNIVKQKKQSHTTQSKCANHREQCSTNVIMHSNEFSNFSSAL